MIALERNVAVRVVAETLSNGAPHPYAGRVGVVLEVRDVGLFPVRVQVGGRPVMFAVDELALHVDDAGAVDDAVATGSIG